MDGVNLEQLGLQLGLAGLLILVGFKTAMVFIDRWGKVEDKKTDALAAGFKAITDRFDAHARVDQDGHTAIAQAHSAMIQRFIEHKGEIESQFEEMKGILRASGIVLTERMNTIYGALELTPPPMSGTTHPPANRTPASGVPTSRGRYSRGRSHTDDDP